jgi:hypothetical protein
MPLVAHPVSTHGLPLHMGSRGRTSHVCTGTHWAFRLGLHGSPGAIGGIEGRSAPGATIVGSPAGLPGPDSIVEAVECAGAGSVDERCVAQDGNVVEAEIPYRGVHHAVAAECHQGTDDSAGGNVVPVVELVDSQSTANKAGTEEGCVDGNELPHSGVVVGEDLELSVEVEVQKYEAGKGGGSVAAGHGLERVIDLVAVTCADAAVEHDGAVAIGDVSASWARRFIGVGVVKETFRDNGLADRKEVRAETCNMSGRASTGNDVSERTSNQPLNEDLEDSCDNQGVQQTNGCVVNIPE